MKKCLLLCLFFAVTWLSTANPLIMRISVENTDSHVQTLAVRRFAERLQEKTEGRIDVRFFSSASLVRDADAVRAMTLGNLEMAVPGTWHVSSLVPEVGLFLLPMFYGVDAQGIYFLMEESPIGEDLTQLIERDLFVEIPGRWIDLGHTHLFSTTQPIEQYEDISGMRIRVAGGYGNEARISAMGGSPTVISWPAVPERLQQGVVDGVLTSYETIRSATLWEYGITYAFEDNQYFAQYIPMISRSFWNSLSKDLREIIVETWEEGVEAERVQAARAQAQAKEILRRNGVSIIVPNIQAVASMRNRLLSKQSEIANALGIPLELVHKTENHIAQYLVEANGR